MAQDRLEEDAGRFDYGESLHADAIWNVEVRVHAHARTHACTHTRTRTHARTHTHTHTH